MKDSIIDGGGATSSSSSSRIDQHAHLDECITVCTILDSCGFAHLAEVFEKAAIGVNDLLTMSEEDLVQMPGIGQQDGSALWKAIDELQ